MMRRNSRRGGPILLALLALSLSGCFGPKPVVVGVNRQPPSGPSDPYRVQVQVHNTGPGDGEIEVSVRFVDKRDGHTILNNNQDVTLETDEYQSVNFELNLPPEAPPADQIDVQVEAAYPIE